MTQQGQDTQLRTIETRANTLLSRVQRILLELERTVRSSTLLLYSFAQMDQIGKSYELLRPTIRGKAV